ncbi:MAG TPA: gluconokinase [Spirochaetia bacterium]|nr:gluconokinase [Spirochaetia bacterium]
MVLSLDMGSSSIRAIVFSDDGLPLPGQASVRPHALRSTPEGGSEADADRLFELLVQCIDEVLERQAQPIEAVALATFWHSMLPVGSDGRALGSVTTWADTRGSAQARELAARFDEERTRARTGTVFHPSYFPARLLRICQTDRRLFDETDWWCSIGEYCQCRLFGTKRCSVSMASGTGLFDQDLCRWDPELLEHLRLPASRLSPIDDSPFHGLTSPFRDRWPGLKDIPWFPALGDGACSNIGCGCSVPGRAAVMIGTSGAMRVVVPSGTRLSLPRGLWRYYADRTRVLVGGALGNGGNLHEWMRQTLRLDRDLEKLDGDLLNRAAACHGLTMLPFLTGERSVGWNPRARAAVIGMSLETTALDILQAGIEAVAYRFAAVQRLLDAATGPAGQTIATGGALLRSRAWTQIIADVLERPVTLSRVSEASSRGAALLALEAVGRISSVDAAPPLLGEVLQPREERRAAHRAAARKQESLYGLLAAGGE